MSKHNPDKQLPSKEEILSISAKNYMNTDQLAYFNSALLALYDATLNNIQRAKAQLHQRQSTSEVGDSAKRQQLSNFSRRTVERQQKLLPEINDALIRVRQKTYGYCKKSGKPIGIARLIEYPTALYAAEIRQLQKFEGKR
ncbi:MAG: DnaK suppressor protein [Flavobacteriales bacterium]|jgi:DnaK suppressor protein